MKNVKFYHGLNSTLRAIVRSSEKFQVRILRPSEFETIREAMDPCTRKICTSLLLTGMRYAELRRLAGTGGNSNDRFHYAHFLVLVDIKPII